VARKPKQTTEASDKAILPPAVIAANAVFSMPQVVQLLNLKRSSIAREVRLKRLRVSKRCGKYLFLGAWLIAWIRSGEIIHG